MIVLMLVLLIVPGLAAALLRLAGLNRGSSIAGGILAGLLLGPTVAGHVWPAQFNEVLHGAETQQIARQNVLIRQQGERIIAQRDALSPPELLQLRERHSREFAVIDLQIQSAVWKHQCAFRFFVMVIAAIVLASSGIMPVPRPEHAQNWVHSASAGFSAAMLPAAAAFVVCRFLWELRIAESAMVAAALSIGPWILSAADRTSADDAEIGGARMVQTAGRIASMCAIGMAMTALLVRYGQRELWMAAPVLIMPLGWLLLGSSSRPIVTKRLPDMCERVLIPCLAACVMLGVDLLEHTRFWPIVVVLILSDDGRWLGAFVGALSLGGRKALRTMRLVMGSMSAGRTQLAVTAVGFWTGLLSPQMALPLLLGAVLIEITAFWRRGLADRIIQLEHDLGQSEAGDGNPDAPP